MTLYSRPCIFLAGWVCGLLLTAICIRRNHVFNAVATGAKVETEAERLSRSVRVFCLVMTTPKHHDSRAIHIMATWGRRCTKLMFISEQLDKRLPIILVNVTTGRNELTVKHRLAWDYVYKNYLNDYDWFFKVDDDAYVIMENLRFLVSKYDRRAPIYFGHHFRVEVHPDGYFSGGSGYILSREAVRRFGRRAVGVYREDQHSPNDDVEMGLAMQKLGVKPQDSRDHRGLITFYVEPPELFLVGPVPNWLHTYDKYTPLEPSLENVSTSSIAFHHITKEHMYNLEFFIYRLIPHGLRVCG